MAKKNLKKVALPETVSVAKLSKGQRYLKGMLTTHVDDNLRDMLQDRSTFNNANKKAIMTLEIHECLEAGHFQYVHEDNLYSPEHQTDKELVGVNIFTLDNGEKVLCLPHDARYEDWRAMYDQLTAE